MPMQKAIEICLKKYFTFSGRATRSEFWYFFLFVTLVHSIGLFVDGMRLSLRGEEILLKVAIEAWIRIAAFGSDDLIQLFMPSTPSITLEKIMINKAISSVMFPPLLAAGWRRLQDCGRVGWFLLLPMVLSASASIYAYIFWEMGGFFVYPVLTIDYAFIVIIFAPLASLWLLTRPSKPKRNQHGPGTS